MLTDLQLIRNIGKYENCSDIPALKKITLIYSENGRGKTTLSSLLRSLAENDSAFVSDRQRLGTNNQPYIRILSTQDVHIFENEAWNTAYPDLLVFDDHFVDKNVYSGLLISHDHCAGLHEIIIGSQSVTVAREIERITSDINAINGELRQAREELTPHTNGIRLDDFIALPVVGDAEGQIEQKHALLSQIMQSEPILKQTEFSTLGVPDVSETDLCNIFRSSLSDIDHAALTELKAHFASLGQEAEKWVQTGMSLAENRTNCPFCNQNIESNYLLGLYRTYFSEEYDSHIKLVAESSRTNVSALRSLCSILQGTSTTTDARRTFWSQYIPDLPVLPPYERLLSTAEVLVTELEVGFRQKQTSPLTPMDITVSLSAALSDYQDTRNKFLQAQESLVAQNVVIHQIKENARSGTRQTVETDIRRLRGSVARHSDIVRPLVKRYLELQKKKSDLENEKQVQRQQLDLQRQTLFPQYQTDVNTYLRRFGADFQIINISPYNRGNTPSVRFALKVNDAEVSTENFKHTLSSGDRSTLALAFFFAQLVGQQSLADTTVVIDDPFTSLDKHRSFTTIQEIRDLYNRARQLIVLSHDGTFLWKLQEPLPPDTKRNELASLKVVKHGAWTKSRLEAWDISEEERTLYDVHHEATRNYSRSSIGEPAKIAPLLRQIMEYFCRVTFPEHFTPGKLLGQFREEERRRQEDGQGLLDVESFRELRDITDYANKFHHTNPNYEDVIRNISDVELKGYVDRVLEFTKYTK